MLKLTHSLLGTLLVHCHLGKSCEWIMVSSPNNISSSISPGLFSITARFPLGWPIWASGLLTIRAGPPTSTTPPAHKWFRFKNWLILKEKTFVPMRSILPVPSSPSASSLRGARASLRSVGTSSGVDQLQTGKLKYTKKSKRLGKGCLRNWSVIRWGLGLGRKPLLDGFRDCF